MEKTNLVWVFGVEDERRLKEDRESEKMTTDCGAKVLWTYRRALSMA